MCDEKCFKRMEEMQTLFNSILNFAKDIDMDPVDYLPCFQILLERISKENASLFLCVDYLSNDPNQLIAFVRILRYSTNPDILKDVACFMYKCVTNSYKNTKAARTAIKQQLKRKYIFKQLCESSENAFHTYESLNVKNELLEVEYYILSIISKLCVVNVPELDINNINSLRFVCCKILPFAVNSNHLRLFHPIVLVLKFLSKNKRFSIEISSWIFYDLLKVGFYMLLSSTTSRYLKKVGSVVTLIKTIAKHDEALHEMTRSSSVVNILICVLNSHNMPNREFLRKYIRSSANILIKLGRIDSGKALLLEPSNMQQMEIFFKTATMEDHYIALVKILSVLFICCPNIQLPPFSSQIYSHPLPDNWITKDTETDLDITDESDNDDEEEIDSDSETAYDTDSYNNNNNISNDNNNNDSLTYKETELLNDFNKQISSGWQPSSLVDAEQLKTLMSEVTYLKHLPSNLSIFKKFMETDLNKINDYYIGESIAYNMDFVKMAHPDKTLFESISETRCLNDVTIRFDREIMLEKLMEIRNFKPSSFHVVFDLDVLLNKSNSSKIEESQENINHLIFESRFEGGNLRKAIKINEFEYNLFMRPDINSKIQRQQWFYFEVSNMLNDHTYTFNIINFDKLNSQYNNGMQPVIYSVKASTLEKNGLEKGWTREGINVVYYCNNYYEQEKKTTFKSLTFSIKFPYTGDICYIAYHYPYTYTRLMSQLCTYGKRLFNEVYFQCNTLCQSLTGNEVPLLTITSNDFTAIKDRPLVLFTSRIHPGEPNASWIMEGLIEFLISDNEIAALLRQKYLFKIAPMLNVDGVIYGNYRNGISGQDMNRCWKNPSSVTPEILHFKELVKFSQEELKLSIAAYIDIHGHSRKKNFFLYGCSPQQSWKKSDYNENDFNYKLLPEALNSVSKSFNMKACKFRIDKNKETTGRIAMWREFGIKCSYTLECTYCGYDQGEYENCKITTKHLKEVGSSLCIALANAKFE